MERSKHQEEENITLENESGIDMQSDGKQILQLSKNQLKKLGLSYKKEPTEKEKERNENLRQMQLQRHEKNRKEKEEYEKKQLEELSKKLAITDKPKQKYTKAKPAINPPSESDSDDADYREYMKFKISKAKLAKSKPIKEKVNNSESEDDRIQKKKTKAKEIIDTVQKIDKTINQIYKNPYMDLFTKNNI